MNRSHLKVSKRLIDINSATLNCTQSVITNPVNQQVSTSHPNEDEVCFASRFRLAVARQNPSLWPTARPKPVPTWVSWAASDRWSPSSRETRSSLTWRPPPASWTSRRPGPSIPRTAIWWSSPSSTCLPELNTSPTSTGSSRTRNQAWNINSDCHNSRIHSVFFCKCFIWIKLFVFQ